MTGEISRTIAALIHGSTCTPLVLHYSPHDPLAIRFRLAAAQQSWYVARDWLGPRLLGHGDDDIHYLDVCASRVDVAAEPARYRALLNLRGTERWPLVVSLTDLAGFVADTYLACPKTREQQLVDDELNTVIGFLQMAHGNGQQS